MATTNSSREAILGDIRQTLKRNPESPVAPRPDIVPPRTTGNPNAELEKLLQEITALKGVVQRLEPIALPNALAELVKAENIHKATLWDTARLTRLGIEARLLKLGVEIIPHTADKQEMATADLGVTEADFALPETGTLGLFSSPDQPRSVSLLPRVHLVILHPGALRADLHQVFAEAKTQGYLILITGPSRTSDIELIVTIGVHGPQQLYVWVVND